MKRVTRAIISLVVHCELYGVGGLREVDGTGGLGGDHESVTRGSKIGEVSVIV